MTHHRSFIWKCGLSGFALTSLLCSTALAQSTAFTYQGRLEAGGMPANGIYDFRFTLYDAGSGGTLIAGPVSAGDVDVLDGLFTVQLDFGAAAFGAADRFLDIAVKRISEPPDPDFVPLAPRQPITPAPVALFALNAGGADGGLTLPFSGEGTAAEPNCVFSISNNGSGKAICGTNVSSLENATGVFGQTMGGSFDRTFGVRGETDSANAGAAGVHGIATGAQASGVYGKTTSNADGATGVFGLANEATGNTKGVWGQTKSTTAYASGVLGQATGGGANRTYGVRGETNSTSGTAAGIYGLATAGPANGVYGKTTSNADSAMGVFGYATGSGNNSGVSGWTDSTASGATGVHGLANGTTGNTKGVWGQTKSTTAYASGVFGQAVGGGANRTYGIRGETDSPHQRAAGVYGLATSGKSNGVFGETNSNSTESAGVYGLATTGKAVGVLGITTSGDPVSLGGYFENKGGGTALRVKGLADVDVLRISGADLAEKFPVSEDVSPGMVVAINPERPGQLCLSRGIYNRCVAGVVSGANDFPAGAILGHLPGHEQAPPIALTGRVWVQCDASTRAIQPGDLLTTAERPGHAMAVDDYVRAQGAIIGKAMTRLERGQGLVLVLVSLQ